MRMRDDTLAICLVTLMVIGGCTGPWIQDTGRWNITKAGVEGIGALIGRAVVEEVAEEKGPASSQFKDLMVGIALVNEVQLLLASDAEVPQASAEEAGRLISAWLGTDTLTAVLSVEASATVKEILVGLEEGRSESARTWACILMDSLTTGAIGKAKEVKAEYEGGA